MWMFILAIGVPTYIGCGVYGFMELFRITIPFFNTDETDPKERLFLACKYGEKQQLDKLIEQLKDNPELISLNAYNNEGYTPLGLACYHGHTQIVEALLNAQDVEGGYLTDPNLAMDISNFDEAREKEYKYPLVIAAENNHVEIVRKLYNINASGQTLAATKAGENGCGEITEILLFGDEDPAEFNDILTSGNPGPVEPHEIAGEQTTEIYEIE
jgi:ankyrin repeat protein